MREGASLNKEHLTVQWLSESITELRNEMSELQESTANVTRAVQVHQQTESPAMEEIRELRDDLARQQLQVKALRQRQEKTDATLRQLRDEATQQSADLKKWMQRQGGSDTVSTLYNSVPLYTPYNHLTLCVVTMDSCLIARTLVSLAVQ